MANLAPHPTAALQRALICLSDTDSADKNRTIPRKRKRIHHKVRTGCVACKARRQKCTEQKPVCAACTRHRTECIYESPGLGVTRSGMAGQASVSITRPASQGHPAMALPCSPSMSFELSSLELLHQWMMYTCVATGQLPDVTAYQQVTVPPLAQKFPFVMHGILAMAAIDLANLRPAQRGHYSLLAWKHHDLGLPDFRSALAHVDEHNYLAAISYAKSILWCSLAVPINSRSISAPAAEEINENWLPQWFSLLRGSCQLVEASRAWIREGPHAIPPLPIPTSWSGGEEDEHLATLMSVHCFRTASPLFEQVVVSLREAFLRASIGYHNTPLRNGINLWASSLPDRYIESVQKDEPWALVVLAHFCILIYRLEGTGFSHGHAVHLMRVLISRLGLEWQCYIQWPCAEMEIDHVG